MARFDKQNRILHAKLVYYGPPLSGKTTNLIQLHARLDEERRTRLFSLNTREDRTLFFDLMPMGIGRLLDHDLRLQIYTVPGQVHYKGTRRMVLRGADACVFVADSRPQSMGANLAAVEDLRDNLAANGTDLHRLPLLYQYNKRDLSDAVSVEQLETALNPLDAPHTTSVASKGDGVVETLRAATEILVRGLLERHGGAEERREAEARAADLVECVFEKFLSPRQEVVRRAVPAWVHNYPPSRGEASTEHPIEVYGDLDAPPCREVEPPTDDQVQVLDPEELLEESLRTQMQIAEGYDELERERESLQDSIERRERETRRLLDRLVEADEAHDDLLTTLGADLQGHLTELADSVERIQRERDPEQARDSLEQAREESEKLQGLVREILAARREVVGGIDASSLLEQAREACSDRIERKGLDVEVKIEEDLPDVMGEESRLVVALRNVLQTAIQASPADAPLRVKIAYKEINPSDEGQEVRRFVTIQVRDFSEGFPQEIWKKLFARGPDGSRSELAASRDIVRRIGGLMQVKSKKGKGNLMTVYLPVAETAAPPMAADRTA